MRHSKHLVLPGIILAALTAAFIALGLWQLDRANQNRQVRNQFNQSDTASMLLSPIADTELTSLRYHPIRLSGRLLADRQILLDNLTYQGQAGYQVLTPLDIGEDRLVLINRGWVPADPYRSRLPDVSMETTSMEIVGRIDRLPRAAMALGDNVVDSAASLQVLSFPEIGEISAALGRPAYAYQVLLDPGAAGGFVREWSPDAMAPERNVAYAVQWFGLAAAAVVIMLLTGMRSLRRTRDDVARQDRR